MGSSVDHPTESLVTPSDRVLRSPATRLRAIAPHGVRWRLDLAASPVTLGRAPDDGTPALVHGTVSRLHARVQWSEDRRAHVVDDLGSRHGTQLDGVPVIGSVTLSDGAILRLGAVFVAYERVEADPAEDVSLDQLPGETSAMARLRSLVARAAPDPSPALVLGATGTGKEWVARELHRLSGRRGPIIAVNCAALAPHLVESQLFGHVRGAFTGATTDSDGLFRAADGGTLLLDEIGELPLELQPKLLRVLQDGIVQPVGGTRTVTVDVRVVAATNRDLPAWVDAGRFRRDLYARLAKWELRLPPLSARRADIPMWLERLWSAWCAARDVRRALPELTAPAWARLLAHAWPDNLRGLDRLIHDLGARGEVTDALDVGDLPRWLDGTGPVRAPTPAAGVPVVVTGDADATGGTPMIGVRPPVPTREEFEAAWRELGGNVRGLARRFARDRRQIYRWASMHGLRTAQGGDDDPEGDGGEDGDGGGGGATP